MSTSAPIKGGQESGVKLKAVVIAEAVTTTPASAAAMWSFLFGVDLIATIEFGNRPPDDPLFSMALELRHLGLKIIDGMWVRVLDVPAALSARRYGVEGRVVFDLEDEFCPWNTGRYELSGGPDGAECRPTDADADLSFTANELGAVYLGGTRLRDLDRGGRVRELTDGAVVRADAMFATPSSPWCATGF